jgi:hypothetical protein
MNLLQFVPAVLPRALRRAAAVLAPVLVMAACSGDGPIGPGAAPTPVLPEPVACRVSRQPLAVSCGSPSSTQGGPSFAIVGGQGRNIWFSMSNPIYDPATDTLSVEVTIRNMSAQPMGTADGLTAHPNGVRVFITQPLPYGITARSDGTANFTQAGQLYWQYTPADFGNPCCLRPMETTAPRRWKFHLNGAYGFLFSVAVSAAMPAEYGVLRWPSYLQAGLLPASGDTVLDLYGSPATLWAFGLTGLVAEYSNDKWGMIPLPDGAGRKIRRFHAAPSCGTCATFGWGITNTEYFYAYSSSDRERFIPTYVGSGGWNAVGGSAVNNFWAVGDSGRIMVNRGTSEWHRLASPTGAKMRAVWVNPTEVWMGGEGGYLYRFDGSTWYPFPAPAGTTVVDLWGVGPTAVWAAAVRSGGSGPESFILFWNGSSWSQAAGPIPTELRAIQGRLTALDDAPNGTSPLRDVYAVGSDRVLHWNGLSWSEQYLDRRGQSLFAVSGTANALWATGGTNSSVWFGVRSDASPQL